MQFVMITIADLPFEMLISFSTVGLLFHTEVDVTAVT